MYYFLVFFPIVRDPDIIPDFVINRMPRLILVLPLSVRSCLLRPFIFLLLFLYDGKKFFFPGSPWLAGYLRKNRINFVVVALTVDQDADADRPSYAVILSWTQDYHASSGALSVLFSGFWLCCFLYRCLELFMAYS
jgi:hypothetical protein